MTDNLSEAVQNCRNIFGFTKVSSLSNVRCVHTPADQRVIWQITSWDTPLRSLFSAYTAERLINRRLLFGGTWELTKTAKYLNVQSKYFHATLQIVKMWVVICFLLIMFHGQVYQWFLFTQVYQWCHFTVSDIFRIMCHQFQCPTLQRHIHYVFYINCVSFYARCEYEATQKSHLVRHLETHNVIKRFQCQHCDYSANTLGYIKIHYTRMHEGCTYTHNPEATNQQPVNSETKVYKCLSCDYLFGNLCDMKRHLKIRHHVQVSYL